MKTKSYMHFCIVACPYCYSPAGVACHYYSGNIRRTIKPHEGRKKLARQHPNFTDASESTLIAGATEHL